MKTLSTLPTEERSDLLLVMAQEIGVPAMILEKDFWVCWLLGRVFDLPELGDS